MSDDFWDDIPKETKPYAYQPSSQAIPHWSEPKPVWAMTEQEFFRSQVAGRLVHHQELHTRQKTKPVVIEHLVGWINDRHDLTLFTADQLAAAEAEVRELRLQGDLPKAYADFERDPLPKTFKEFRSKHPRKPNPRFHDSTPTPDDDCLF